MVFDIEMVSDEGLDFKFQIYKDQFEIDQKDYFLNRDVDVNGCLSRIGDDVYLKGNVNTELTLKCSRCLDPLIHIVDSGLKAHFVPSDHAPVSVGEVELHASDIDTEVYENHRIDLTQSILDGILLAIPFVCLCSNDCRGMCPQCGKKINQYSCECAIELFIDPRLEDLKKLKDKIK